MPRDRSSPPIAARDLFVSDGVGAPSQGVQGARLEVVGRALTGGTVQPGRGLDKHAGRRTRFGRARSSPHTKRGTFSPGPRKFPAVVGCVAANAARLARHLESSRVERWRRWSGRQGGRVRQNFLEIELSWENHDSTVPPQRRAGPFRFRRWGIDRAMGPESSPRSFRTNSAGGDSTARTEFEKGEEGGAAAPKEYELGRSSCPPVRRRQEAPPRADPIERSVHHPHVQQPPSRRKESGSARRRRCRARRHIRRPTPLATPPLGAPLRRIGELESQLAHKGIPPALERRGALARATGGVPELGDINGGACFAFPASSTARFFSVAGDSKVARREGYPPIPRRKETGVGAERRKRRRGRKSKSVPQ